MDLETDKKPSQMFNQQINFHRNNSQVSVPIPSSKDIPQESKSALYIQQQQQYDMQLENSPAKVYVQPTACKEDEMQNQQLINMMEESKDFGT